MSDELREMVAKFIRDGTCTKGIKEILAWHKSERKKWALGLLKEEEERVAKWNEQYQAQKDGVKDVIFSIRKSIEGDEGTKIKCKGEGLEIGRPYSGDIGYDLKCEQDIKIPSKGWMVIPVDCHLEIPDGYYAVVTGRSGLAMKGILCHQGLIDTGYRGMVAPILFNFSAEPIVFRAGDRVGQVVFKKITPVEIIKENKLSKSERGEKGFGSSGN